VEQVEGAPGSFKVTVKKAPRYIDASKCTACGDCQGVCPVILPNEYDQGLSERRAAYKKYPQAIPGAFAIQKADKAPCRLACPAGLNVQGYVQMVGQGKYKEALEIIMEDLPLPGVLGRICPHGCENACRRCEVDEAVAIRNLKRLAADQFDPRQIEIQCAPPRDEKVAIIGSGPAGLSAAYHLARKGIKSTIFEALPAPGGMLRVGIPEHRLPRKTLDQEIELITNLGVEIKTDTPLGYDMTVEDLFAAGFKAVYLAIGAHKGIELRVPGESAEGVRQGVDFLRELNLTGRAEVGKKVAIIGGGNVAIDVARSAVRLGAGDVQIIYRRTRAEMPAWEEEIQAAEEEGTKITYLSAPQEVLTQDGRVVGLQCIRMELGEPDSSGRRRPIRIPGSEYDIEIDQLIPAIGQRPDLSVLENVMGLDFSRWGTIEVDPITYATNRDGVFAGGDMQTGPWVAIRAIAAGREAAESIVRYLDGRDMAEGREPITNENPIYRPVPEGETLQPRAKMPALPIDNRKGNFEEVELGYDEAIGQREAHRCLNCGYCCECFECVEACGPGAVTLETHAQQPESVQLKVGSIILAPGFHPFDPSRFETYNYAKHPSVITSLEFERILSASGPTMGHLVRLSDDKEPKKIAWIQCVGSRDINQCDHSYCSSVCCMYAIKEAVIAKEHAGDDLDCAIFFMDMRTHGKDFERYYNDARDRHGVRFIRSRVHTIDPIEDSNDLLIKYATEDGKFMEETFDMVILSVGIEISSEVKELAEKLDVELNEGGFCLTDTFHPVNTSQKGIYVSGAFQGPKDIPQSVMEACAASCAAGVDLSPARGTEVQTQEIAEERDVTDEEPKIGVFVCNCGTNIGGVVDVPAVAEYASSLPYVDYVDQNLFTCAQDTQDKMKALIQERGLNRVVVAACSPMTHQALFQETIQACGLNQQLFEMANIRNQDSWVHSDDPAKATDKAKDLVRMAVARATLLKPLRARRISINKRALIIGGGVAGMTAALGLGDQGFEVVLVEKENRLGGLVRELTHTIEGENINQHLLELIDQVERHEKIQVLTESLIVGFGGFKGNFTTEVLVGPGMYERKIDHGVVVLATGANEYRPKEYLYGEDERVVTQIELAKRLEMKGASDLNDVVMIQCVGSRDDDFPNCSRICCQNAVKNALHIKELNPEANVYVLYRDIRTYGLLENYYREARRQGVIFVRFDKAGPPRVESTVQGLSVLIRDHILQRDIQISPDLLVLSAGMRAQDTEELASILKVPRNQDGYFMEAHVKLRPVDMANDAIFVCGTAHGPKLITESISQAMAAASRAATFLSQSEITLSVVTAKVDQERCASCLICVRSCPYGVPHINQDGVSEIDPALCRGCGICAGECPAKVIQLNWYEDDQVLSKVEALLEGVL
jgi:heterodisulfide reductase subunit A-like polyferredoxin